MTRGEAWYKWCPAAHFYFFYFFYFDLDGHFTAKTRRTLKLEY